MSKITWHDMDGYSSDCESIVKINNLTMFKIMSARDYYYSMYNNQMFKTASLTYFKAAELAEEKFKKDSLENRLKVAKEFFLKDFKRQLDDINMYLCNITIEDKDVEDSLKESLEEK